MQEQENHNKFLCFQVSRNIIQLAKNFLILLEELRDNGRITVDEYQRLRSKVLGHSNDISRDLQTTIENFEVKLKSN